MAKLSVLSWIGNAAAVLFGSHGSVSRQAQQVGCSRQTAYDHAVLVQEAVAAAQLPGPTRDELLEENQRLRRQVEQLQQQVQQHSASRIDLGKDKQKQLATTAWAMGLSLRQIEELLALLLPAPQAPARATLGHWLRQAAHQAGAVLRVLDAAAAPRVQVLCPDEIFFHGRPVLVGVEPHSMALLLCRRSPDRQGETWKQALLPFTALEAVVRDAGSGLSAGVTLLNRQRSSQPGGVPVEDCLDVFHTEQEAQRLLGQVWRRVEGCWAEAEQAQATAASAAERGRDGRGPAARARSAWQRAFEAFARYEQVAARWERARAALRLFRADGRLNDRAWAAGELAAVCQGLRGPSWRKVRSFLEDARTLTFLDRTQRLLEEAEPRPQLREALVELWRLEHPGAWAGRPVPAGLRVAQGVVQRVICARLAPDWERASARVSAVLQGVVRASSAVECVNSVLRMQQARHRTMTQGMLDLKRLYWNSRRFRTGKRKDRCPYQHLGLPLPTFDFWTLLQSDPQGLAQQLSTPTLAA